MTFVTTYRSNENYKIQAQMKKYLILLLLLSVKVWAQSQIANEKVENFINYLKPYTENPEKLSAIDKLNDEEIKRYVKMRYEAFEDDIKLIITKNLEQAKEVEKTRKGQRTAVADGRFLNMLEEKYSKNFGEFISIPYLVRARITAIKDSTITSEGGVSPQIKMITKVLVFEVLDVLRGTKEFQTGKTYKCYYGNTWRKFGSDDFAKGGTYLLALDPRLQPDTREWSTALITYQDDNSGLYKIEDGNLIDKYNFFSLGNIVPWTEFVSGYNKKVEAIKNGEF